MTEQQRPGRRGSGFAGKFDPHFKYGQQVHGDVRALMPDNTDAFGRLIADGTNNFLDLPSHYDVSPERYRLQVNGTRTKPDDTAKFTDGKADFVLTADAGDNLIFYTAERPRYVVGSESEASFEFQLLDALEAGDYIRVGITDFDDNRNQAYFEFTSTENKCVIVNEGTIVAEETFQMPDGADIMNPIRAFIQFNWYRVGRFLYGLTYTDRVDSDGDTRPIRFRQLNEDVEELTVDDQGSTNDANLHLFWELDVDTGNATKELSCGSSGYKILSQNTATTRAKAARFTELPITNSGEYEPVMALRVDPNRDNVFAEITESEVIFESGDGELIFISVDPALTDADFLTDPTGDGVTAGPVSPPQHNSTNSVIQYTVDVTTFPDEDDNIVSTSLNAGGYQISFSSSDVPQTGSGGRNQSSLLRKRPLHSDNVCVILAKRDQAQATTVNVTFETEQDW